MVTASPGLAVKGVNEVMVCPLDLLMDKTKLASTRAKMYTFFIVLCPMPRDTLRTMTIRQKKTEKPTLRKIKRGASQHTKPTLLHHI